jgi:hypothetical protein
MLQGHDRDHFGVAQHARAGHDQLVRELVLVLGEVADRQAVGVSCGKDDLPAVRIIEKGGLAFSR